MLCSTRASSSCVGRPGSDAEFSSVGMSLFYERLCRCLATSKRLSRPPRSGDSWKECGASNSAICSFQMLDSGSPPRLRVRLAGYHQQKQKLNYRNESSMGSIMLLTLCNQLLDRYVCKPCVSGAWQFCSYEVMIWSSDVVGQLKWHVPCLLHEFNATFKATSGCYHARRQ